jgi:hypothetical protein
VFLRDQALEARSVEGRLHVARKARRHDDWDLPIEPYDRYGPESDFVTGHGAE